MVHLLRSIFDSFAICSCNFSRIIFSDAASLPLFANLYFQLQDRKNLAVKRQDLELLPAVQVFVRLQLQLLAALQALPQLPLLLRVLLAAPVWDALPPLSAVAVSRISVRHLCGLYAVRMDLQGQGSVLPG